MSDGVGEVAAVWTDGGPARAEDAARLLTGYAGASQSWSDGRAAVAWGGAAEVAILDDLVVVFDGRLDNRLDLANRFGAPSGTNAARVLAEGWRRLGERLVDLVIGDVAAIVLERRSSTISAFRDLCAGRPLHVSHEAGGWGVASEWAGLLESRNGARRLKPNPEWFAGAFIGQLLDPRATPYLGVEMVLPGYVATPSATGWRQAARATWHIPTLRDRRPGAYADQFRELFDQAVCCRLNGSGRVGVALSGGLDSTSVIASAAAVRPEVARTALCVPMLEPAGDERELQRLVARRSCSDLQWVDLDGYGPFGPDGPEALFARFGAPPYTINWFIGDAIASKARALGLRLVLDGEDGDGAVGGTVLFLSDLLGTGRWRTWLREAKSIRSWDVWGWREMFFQDSLSFLAPPWIRRASLRRRAPSLAPPVLADRLKQDLDLDRRLLFTFPNRSWRPGRTFRYMQSAVGQPEHLGPVFTAITEPWRRTGLCLTHPWTDRRLLSFCMGLPYEHIISTQGLSKIVLRQAMASRLPQQVVTRRIKAELSEVARRAAFGPAHKYIEQGLRVARGQPEWFTTEALDSIESTFESGSGEAIALRAAMFGLWLRWADAA